MFRNLIPRLCGRYHVIAPDYLGFGFSAAPQATEIEYTFDVLADSVSEFLGEVGVDRFAMYVQDYGAPIGWRLAVKNPNRITAIISQNGNAYEEGFIERYWDPIWDYSALPGPETEKPIRYGMTLDAIKWQYTHGVPDVSLVSPDCWLQDFAMIQRRGQDEIQLSLARDYPSNFELYPLVHQYFVRTRVPMLVCWGANDLIFRPEGAIAFSRHLPEAEVHLLDAGHFALESDLDTIVAHVSDFLFRVI
jgi:pimeloyl-ACP methyl ester carboxylesterase